VGNPLVAEVKSSTQSYPGVSLLETAHDLKSAIQSGDWASVALGSVGTALNALSMAMDPVGAILAAGVVGRLAGQTDFDARTRSYDSDVAGQLARSVDADGAATEYVHDLLGNLVEVRTPSGTTPLRR
jgi:YD repeat-containing protein